MPPSGKTVIHVSDFTAFSKFDLATRVSAIVELPETSHCNLNERSLLVSERVLNSIFVQNN